MREDPLDPLESMRLQYQRRRAPDHIPLLVKRRIRRELQSAVASFLTELQPLKDRTLLEIGAAAGANVPYHLELGFLPTNVVLNDIRPEAIAEARKWASLGVRAVAGDAATLSLPLFDVVYAATVFTSILSTEHRRKVAAGIWRLTKPGGGVLLYDFIYNNPRNSDVRRLTLKEIHVLFPKAAVCHRRVTLAPPLARRIPVALFPVFNIPFLKTHLLCWLRKLEPRRDLND